MKFKLPSLEKVNYKSLPFDKQYVAYVLKKYLFEGVSQSVIDQGYVSDEINNTGKFASYVLDYFGLISNDGSFNNKGIYQDLSIDEVCSFLRNQGKLYKQIPDYITMNNEKNPLEEFKKFYFENIQKIKENSKIASPSLKEEFLNRFPIESFKTMELNDYSL